MTNYEKICAIINAGHIAVGETATGFYVFNHISMDGGIRYSASLNLSSALDCLGRTIAGAGNINDRCFTRIYALSRPLPKYKQGDKVVVLDNIKETMTGKYLMVDKVYTIQGTWANGSVLLTADDGGDTCVLPQCVAPYFEDDQPIEEMTVEQICKALGKTIKIVK